MTIRKNKAAEWNHLLRKKHLETFTDLALAQI